MAGFEVRFENLSRSFADPDGNVRRVLDGLSGRLEAGAFALLHGPSGSGKSTFLNLIAGLMRPDGGTIRVGELDVHTLSERARDDYRARHLGYVFQTFNLITPLSVLENLTVPAALCGLERDEDRARAILEDLGLGEHLKKKSYQLSVGQRQRVAVARAVHRRPKLLLADEPTASLDPAAAKAVIDAMLGLRETGTTLIVASHDPAMREAAPDAFIELGATVSGGRAS
ncbi:MAG: ABC transporter ATP-binding protein [Deltaproteobacteria bacterium]|nr:ABC transporter ATP-binding protein [Deltaproteobacteria bacterium]MCB9479501.1 ABC transporter ATP-binding protein [Deltaproteobacteria bacterium]MCB9489615.1 ABC transporter ATP-binding protein [Deltaproteobacteria bacterium]